MERGGNAIDGAIAANAVQGVVAPDTCGIGGDLFALIHRPGDPKPLVLNSSGAAGSGVSAQELRRDHKNMPYRHPWTITVPGCVAGWVELSTRHGALPLEVSLGPAIELASNGFPVSAELANSLHRLREMIGSQPSAAPLYPTGAPPAPGTTLRRPGLAHTLGKIATDGFAAFYTGAVAEAVAAATDGAVTVADMATAEPDWVEPIGVDVFGLTAWTVPPNTQGYITLAACWLLEQLGPPRDPADPAYVHAAIEAYRAVAWERDELVADPATAPLAAEALVDPSRLAAHLDRLDPNATVAWPNPKAAPGGTAYMCVRDRAGVGVSLIAGPDSI
jgi:gamma-glutamyltranspeptidase/glutathione hydrolase